MEASRGQRQAVPPQMLVLAAIVSVQTGAAFARTLFDTVGPAGATLLRIALGALLLLAFVRPRRLPARGRPAVLVVAFGLVLAAMNFSFYLAIDRIPLGIGVAIEFWGPLAVAVAGSRRPRDLVWVALAAVGVVLFGLERGTGEGAALGFGFAALAGAFWATYIVVGQRLGEVVPVSTGLALALPVSALAVLPAGLLGAGDALLEPSTLGVGLAVGLLSTVIPYSLELLALRRMTAAVFGVLMSLEPAAAALAGLVVLGELLDPLEWLALVLVSLACAGASAARPAPPEPTPQ